MFRSLLRIQRAAVSFPGASVARLQRLSLRFNSTTSASAPASTPKSEPKEPTEAEEAEAWLSAIRQIRERYVSEGVPHFGSPQMAQLSANKFEPSAEQLAKWESLQEKPIPEKMDSVVQHCTNMIMKSGKKARAQRVMAKALYLVRLQLRKDPVEVLKETLDKMAPLMQLKTYKTRVAKNLTVPVPLNQRQRDRRAFEWIIEGSEKRRSKDFAVRLGEEILSAYEGKSSGYEKRLQMHKAAMLHRAYIKLR